MASCVRVDLRFYAKVDWKQLLEELVREQSEPKLRGGAEYSGCLCVCA